MSDDLFEKSTPDTPSDDKYSIDAILKSTQDIKPLSPDEESDKKEQVLPVAETAVKTDTPKYEPATPKQNLSDYSSKAYLEKQKNAPKKKKRKKRGVPGFVWGIVIAAISLTLAFGIVVCMCEIMGIGKEMFTGDDPVQVYIEEGATVRQIAKQLKDKDIIISENFFLLYLKLKDEGSDFNYGYHDFDQNMGYKQIISSLEEPAKKEDLEVTIPQTATVDEIAKLLENKNVCSAQSFKEAALHGTFESELLDAVPTDDSRIYYRVEGYLFPDTYRFFENDDPERVIQKMLDNLEEHYTDEMRRKTAELGYTTHEMMTMASIVELEACGYYDEMSAIAAVFWNRMNDWGAGERYLQSDPTMEYPYGDGAYNTYESEGLPPGPLCNISAQAIEGTVYPLEEHDYYFFVTDSKHRFYYNETVSGHNSTIQSLISKGLWAE